MTDLKRLATRYSVLHDRAPTTTYKQLDVKLSLRQRIATASISNSSPGIANSGVPTAVDAGYGSTRYSRRTLRKIGKSRSIWTQ